MDEMLFLATDIATLIVVGAVWLCLSIAMLRHVVFWTGLGRSLFFLFLMTALAVAHSLLWRFLTGGAQPPWATLTFRIPIFCAASATLYFLWRYPWPLPAEGIRWMDLLGLRREETADLP